MTYGIVSIVISPRHQRFVTEYCVDFNATKAYIRAGYSENGAGEAAHKLLKNNQIIDAIEEQKEANARVAGLSRDWIINQWLQIAQADPNELVNVRRCCCRHCWGFDHAYQWTEREYLDAVEAAVSAKKPKAPPECVGGMGFDAYREPASDCPECHGEGFERSYVADSRKLKGSARRLYAGAKQTKDGIEIKMRDQDAALNKLANYMGMVVTKTEMSGPGGGPMVTAGLTAKDFTDDQLALLIAVDNPKTEE
jgi:phage terminase small subunit